MLEILLIRHGQTDWNKERRIMGSQPIGLNAAGREQIERLSERLRSISFGRLYSSPLQRTLETAEILNQGRGLTIERDPALQEIEYGEWTGKTFQEVRLSPGFESYYKYPDRPVGGTGESLQQVQSRGVNFLEGLRKQGLRGSVAVVSHADWIKCMILHYLRMPLNRLYQFRMDNASVSFLSFEGETERVISINNTLELEGLLIPRGPL
jgi:broad specificity phosphatase PhoE